jgi:hypothetical protein
MSYFARNSWMAFVVAVLQATTINLHFISNKKRFSYSKLQSLVSILVHKVHWHYQQDIYFFIRVIHGLLSRLKFLQFLNQNSIGWLLSFIKNKLHAKQRNSNSLFKQKTAQPIVRREQF